MSERTVKGPRGQNLGRPRRSPAPKGSPRTRAGSTQTAKPTTCDRQARLHALTRTKLKLARDEARARSRECEQLKARLELAFSGAGIHAFEQDRALRYIWIADAEGLGAPSPMLGRTDDELWSMPEQQTAIALKRRVLQTGVPEACEVSYITPGRRALFALHVSPILSADGSINGIMCTAVDISRVRSLESEQQRLSEDLVSAVQRYEFALRGSNVAVFTQDTDLRYTSVSKPLFGLEAAALRGKTDGELLAGAQAAAMMGLKNEALKTGEPRDGEVKVENAGSVRWYDLHVEPMRDVSGRLNGVIGAAVDITEQKEYEAHLRLLLRELTHRSKNLLAVIQGMARQTARHTGNVQTFLERFSARVQALSRSHDLLVQQSWHGASLSELVRSQLAHYLDRESDQILIDGPDIHIKPEAAQSLGLALHELAANAAKHGALSRSGGRVEIRWHARPNDGGFELLWRESKGPKVSAPKHRGFGSMVIEHNLTRALDAEVHFDFAAEGLTCRVTVPKDQVTALR